jgi:uncharacterized protein
MNELSVPLTDEEYDRLDRFLLDRIDEDADTPDMDEGVLGISELDGLFTALVSGPTSVMPSQWLLAVWGDCQPVWDNEEEFKDIFSLMVRHMNEIATVLMDYPKNFEPLFLERKIEGETYIIVDEWCEGYRRGVELAQEHWNNAGARSIRSVVCIDGDAKPASYDESFIQRISPQVWPGCRLCPSGCSCRGLP